MMIYFITMYLVLFLFNVFFYRHVATAFCCQTKSKSSLDRNEWLSDVGTLDELHMQYLKKTILSNMRINKVPEEAKRWRRTRSIEALLEQSPSIIDDFNENDENIRYYSLKVVGLQTTKTFGHRKKRIHHHYRNGHKGYAAHFEFMVKLSETGNINDYETILEKAELQLPVYGSFVLHTNHSTMTLDRNRDVVGQTYSNEKDPDSSSVQGRHRIVDVTPLLRPVWSPKRGTNVSLTWKNRRQQNRDVFTKSSTTTTTNLKSIHHNHNDNIRPILRVELKEKKTRHDKSLSKRHIDISFQRNVRRQDIIIDCEQQWDAAFLRNISTEVYDGLMPCCRRKVKVDFNELGWDHWVVAPQSFDSYYCIGRCTHFGGFASEDTEGASFYTELMNLQRRARSLGLSPCCSPVKFSPLTITVLTGDNEEMTQTLEDVVVRQCGCM